MENLPEFQGHHQVEVQLVNKRRLKDLMKIFRNCVIFCGVTSGSFDQILERQQPLPGDQVYAMPVRSLREAGKKMGKTLRTIYRSNITLHIDSPEERVCGYFFIHVKEFRSN